jgi:hypothetical protein
VPGNSREKVVLLGWTWLRKEPGLRRRTVIFVIYSGVPRNFLRGGGGSTNSVGDRGQRERGSWGSSPLVRGSGGSCNLVKEISFHIVNFS